MKKINIFYVGILVLLVLIGGFFFFSFDSDPLGINDISFLTENAEPLNYVNSEGVVTGISYDILSEVAKRNEKEFHAEVLPWTEALGLMLQGGNRALFSTAQTPSRIDEYNWAGPISYVDVSFFVPKNSGVVILSIEDAKKLTSVGVVQGFASQESLDVLGFENLVYFDSIDSLSRGLSNGDVESVYEADILFNRGELFDSSFTYESFFLYLAFSKDVDLEIVNYWQSEIDALSDAGFLEEITEKYLGSKVS